MIYPATFEQKIGFDRLREQVAERCTMRAARERIAAEGFSSDFVIEVCATFRT